MATVRDVAKLSGVSPATVTHVLHNRSNITPETRQRVLRAVRALNYRPGAVPKNGGNAERTTKTLGVFVWLAPGFPLQDNPYAAQVFDGILSVALTRQWNVTLCNVMVWEDAPSQLRYSVDGRCDGFILIAPPPRVGIPDALRERGYPFVLVNSGSSDPAVDNVDIDNRAAACEITRYLIGQGHRRIAFLPGGEHYENTVERLQGFIEGFQEAGLPDPSPWILRPGNYDYAQSQGRVNMLLERMRALPEDERPTALIAGNDKLARAAAEVFTRQGVVVPEQMSLVGFDDTYYARDMTPALTTVHQPLHTLGVRPAEILLERLAAVPDAGMPASPAVKEFLPFSLVYRESVRPR